jgi:hypothetical protein
MKIKSDKNLSLENLNIKKEKQHTVKKDITRM